MWFLKTSTNGHANGSNERNGRESAPAIQRVFTKYEDLLTEEAFNAQIRKERLRADRTDGVFSVAMFSVPALHGQDVERGLLSRLVEQALSHCRESDVKGLVRHSGRTGVGILMPGCTREETARVVQEMNAAYRDALRKERAFSELQVDVWQYPSSTPLFGNGLGEGEVVIAAASGDVDAQRLLDHVLPRPMPAWKRAIDIFGAGVALALFSPVMLMSAAAIRMTSPGPVLFRQTRAGYLGRPFELFKFRTMHNNVDTQRHREQMRNLIRNGRSIVPSEREDAMVKLEDRNQIIPVVGRLLRASCIDELPQLINTLRGEMSLVGPRPPIPYEAAEYSPWHLERFDAVPGMTGLWQVSGKNRLSFQDMVRLDIQYGRRRSIWLDLWILASTPVVVAQLFIESISSERK